MVEAAHAQPAWVLLAYLIAGVCFILALRGLSGPESSRRGNRLGMIGMAIAVVTTLITHAPWVYLEQGRGLPDYDIRYPDLSTWSGILGAIVIGGAVGLITARKIQMTA